jgi:DNA-binding CsgD family transcriptional regulator
VDETHLTDVVASAYEAATGGSTWFEFGALLCDLVGAQRATLRMTDGTLTNLLRASDQADADYLDHYHLVDPYRARFAGNFASGGSPPNSVSLGQDIMPRSRLLLSEYFTDYAVRHGQQHMMGGTIGLSQPPPIGLHRDATAGAFTEDESRKLELVLPHLTRALQLRSRMLQDVKIRAAETMALDALSHCVIVVDAAMHVLHANSAAVALTAGSRSGLRIFAPGRGGLRLAARHRDDSRHLEHLVAAAAAGGSGGSLRVRAQPDDVSEMASLAVLVSPAPTRFAAGQSRQPLPGLASGTALVVARELARPLAVAPARLSDLYGLTHAEAAIAVSLAGGVTAEGVARGRQVSLDTVRSQVRTVLRKTNAANLRDFERILALVSAS